MGERGDIGSEVVGREEELASIERFLSDHDFPRALVLEGEAGIGKTTLWQAVIRAAERLGYRVVASRPAGAEVRLSFSALLADDRFRVRSGRSLRVRFAVSAAGRVQLELRKGSRRLAVAERSLGTAGVGVLRLYARSSGSRRGRRLAPGNYLLRLTGTGDDGQRATDSARLRITR